MGKLIIGLLKEIEYTLDNLEMYRDLGCQIPDALAKCYNEVMDDCRILHLTRQVRDGDDDLMVKIHKMEYLRSRVRKISEQ